MVLPSILSVELVLLRIFQTRIIHHPRSRLEDVDKDNQTDPLLMYVLVQSPVVVYRTQCQSVLAEKEVSTQMALCGELLWEFLLIRLVLVGTVCGQIDPQQPRPGPLPHYLVVVWKWSWSGLLWIKDLLSDQCCRDRPGDTI